jgi:hypothetical protein
MARALAYSPPAALLEAGEVKISGIRISNRQA